MYMYLYMYTHTDTHIHTHTHTQESEADLADEIAGVIDASKSRSFHARKASTIECVLLL